MRRHYLTAYHEQELRTEVNKSIQGLKLECQTFQLLNVSTSTFSVSAVPHYRLLAKVIATKDPYGHDPRARVK